MLSIVLGLLVTSTINMAMAYDFSITYVEDYKYSDAPWPCTVGDLEPWGHLQADKVEEWLNKKAGWNLRFRMSDSLIRRSRFPLPRRTWVQSSRCFLALWNWSPCYGGLTVSSSDVNKKWDLDNEWVFLHSCHVLSDVSGWDNALKYSHIIMGFSTVSYTSTELIDRFFRATIDWDWTSILLRY